MSTPPYGHRTRGSADFLDQVVGCPQFPARPPQKRGLRPQSRPDLSTAVGQDARVRPRPSLRKNGDGAKPRQL